MKSTTSSFQVDSAKQLLASVVTDVDFSQSAAFTKSSKPLGQTKFFSRYVPFENAEVAKVLFLKDN